MMRIGLLGGGYWGTNILRTLLRIPDIDVRFCDADPIRAGKIRIEFPGLSVSTDPGGILHDEDIHAVCVATPASTHYAITQQALALNKHVYVEKPLSLTAKEAFELVDLARRHRRILLVGHVFRYSTAAQAVKQLLQNGEIGTLRYLHSVRTSLGPRVRGDVNAIWDYSIHDIYLSRYFLDRMPESVSAWGASFLQPDIEDVVFLKLNFADGVIAHLHGSWYDPCKRRDMTLVGSRGAIRYDESNENSKVILFRRGWMPFEGRDELGNRNLTVFDLDTVIPPIEPCEPLMEECRHFIDCVRTGDEPLSGGIEACQSVQIAEAAEHSLGAKGVPIRLETGAPSFVGPSLSGSRPREIAGPPIVPPGV